MNDSFFNLLAEINEFGSIKSPDFLAYVLPLLKEVKALHDKNLIAQLINIDQISYTQQLQLKTQGKEILRNENELFFRPKSKNTLEVVETLQEVVSVGSFETEYKNLNILGENEEEISKPVYIANYKIWDYEKGHYDPLTDCFALGQLMASIAFGLDFRNQEDLELFVGNRKRLYFLNKNLHPTLLNVIFEMTQLYREDRPRSLEEVIAKLSNYREYNYENYVDLSQTAKLQKQDLSNRNSWILGKLKNRLFDISRRNKLLYYRSTASFMNLTVSSFPILLDHKNVSEDSLIFWGRDLENKLNGRKKLNLNNYLDFQNNGFLAPQLNKIRLEARKSKNEYGFSPLKMVVAFLHWYNFKEDGEEKISSPLLLLPAEIVKKKAIKDIYHLQFEGAEAEINPILSNFLKDLYDIELPQFIYLEQNAIEDLIQSIQRQIALGNTGIVLEWHKKPRIQIIHRVAKKNFQLKNRKLLNRSRNLRISSFNYSYKNGEFKPLGLQLFNDRVRPKKSELEYLINDDILPNKNAVGNKEKMFYTNSNESETNPLLWEIDTCNITLGNFNYRKMSLVRDYNEIVSEHTQSPIFDQLFGEKPKTLSIEASNAFRFEENYPIISADPTQTAAIQYAQTGKNYIIQGPPGTGKSQTITNLIADYIARDKKILFVCEKRAALDVVFHRLKNKNLHELCSLIHDSQTDKKAFIQNLKSTYENFIQDKLDQAKIEQHRNDIIAKLNKEIGTISYFHRIMAQGETSTFDLLSTILSTQKNKRFPSQTECVYLPQYSEWQNHKDWISEWLTQLKNNQFKPYISEYIFAQLDSKFLASDNPKAILLEQLDTCTLEQDAFTKFIQDNPLEINHTLGHYKQKFDLAHRLKAIVQQQKFSVFDAYSREANRLKKATETIAQLKADGIAKKEANANWTTKFNATDTQEALNQWQNFSKSIFRFFKPSYYALKKQIQTAYNFEKHKVKPSIASVLEKLNAEYTNQEKLEKTIQDTEAEFGLQDLESEYTWILKMQENPSALLKQWLASNNTNEIAALNRFYANFDSFYTNASNLWGKVDKLSLEQISEKLVESKSAVHSLAAFIPFLEKRNELSTELRNALYEKAYTLEDFEFNIAYKSLHDVYEKERPFEAITEDSLQLNIRNVNRLLEDYYTSNVDSIRAKIRSQFLDKIRITESVAAQLTEDEKVLKKKYNKARKILENEFNKSMRYKSIRELASGDARHILTSLKPVWLMSPLSVSDTMPINTKLFDVVIYDEASQITVEEGVPALFRTKQTIIVGDEMQMPPTNFFSSQTTLDEEDEAIEDELGISLDSDSILNQGTRKLASVMLGWHYRSRRESLISFSNAAFYQRNLLTIPDCKQAENQVQALAPVLDVLAPINSHSILSRSISFHHIENAVYHQRKNTDEANYIANIVCTLLKEKVEKSIGIVAFSMQQQAEIEQALEKRAAADSEFEILLEEAYQKIEDDSFAGLFVKNLENVQGDERDIIIMSVCYGTNTQGRMLMNFGPINRKGGEKRLNVIFSRSKQHMVVVSSILAHQIKNDYNVGANYFKKFLAYAQHISNGKTSEANTILDGLHSYPKSQKNQDNAIKTQLKQAIESLGYIVDLDIGQSHFKCDLAIKTAQHSQYKLGILLDKHSHYQNQNVLEQYCQKPQILNAFGWQTLNIYAKDWLENKSRILEKIQTKLQENT